MFNLRKRIFIVFAIIFGLAPLNALSFEFLGKAAEAYSRYDDEVTRQAYAEQAEREAHRAAAHRAAEAEQIRKDKIERDAAAAKAIFWLGMGAFALVGKGVDYVVDTTAGAFTSEAEQKSNIKKFIYGASVAGAGILIYKRLNR